MTNANILSAIFLPRYIGTVAALVLITVTIFAPAMALPKNSTLKSTEVVERKVVRKCRAVIVVSEKSKDVFVVNKSKFRRKFTRADDIYNLLNNTIEQVIKLNDTSSCSSGQRVELCVTGHFPFNGCYEFGSASLECADLLGDGEEFPGGVTCTNI